MKSTISPPLSKWCYAFVCSAFFAALLLVLVQLEFCRLTCSVLLFGQGILQLSLTIMLLLRWLRPNHQWQLLAQFFNSLFVLLLCGWLMNQAYIHWQEEVAVLTAEALPILLLSCGGLFLLSRLFIRLNEEMTARPGHKMLASILPYLSAGLAAILLLTHLTGWFWLDKLVGGSTALLLGLGAIFFLLDGYWNMLEVKT